MPNCPHCNKPISIRLMKGKEKKQKAKKNPNEPMSIDQFINGCRQSTRVPLQIIGEFADQLRDMYGWDGYKTRGEWQRLFVQPNIRAANDLAPAWNVNGSREKFEQAVGLIEKDTKNGEWRWSHLETLKKYMSKV